MLYYANNIPVILEEMPNIRSISLGVFIKNGSRNETAEQNGISHFIEHMLFKGTGKRTAKMIADEADAIGAQLNAYTAKEHTCLYVRSLDTHFPKAFELIEDILLHPRFDEADIEKERGVVLEELNMREDSPEDLAHDLIERIVFGDEPLGFSVLGEISSILEFNNRGLVDYYLRNYHQDNIIVVATGNFKREQMLAHISKAFAPLARETVYVPPIYSDVYQKGSKFIEKDNEQTHICMGFPSINARSDNIYALSALSAILGGGMSSRLFQSIREEAGLVYSIYSYNSGYADKGCFVIYAALTETNVTTVLDLIHTEIDKLYKVKITETELAKSKEQLKSNTILSLESSASRMGHYGRVMIARGHCLTLDEVIAKIDAVSLPELYVLAEQILSRDKMSLATVGRKKIN